MNNLKRNFKTIIKIGYDVNLMVLNITKKISHKLFLENTMENVWKGIQKKEENVNEFI